MALTLFRRELDVWTPGEHNGTFRGHNPAFVTAAKALETYWETETFVEDTLAKGRRVRERLDGIAGNHPGVTARGRGMAQGLKFEDAEVAGAAAGAAFERGLLVETSGPADEVIKLLPPLTTSEEDLDSGIEILAEAIAVTVA